MKTPDRALIDELRRQRVMVLDFKAEDLPGAPALLVRGGPTGIIAVFVRKSNRVNGDRAARKKLNRVGIHTARVRERDIREDVEAVASKVKRRAESWS